MSNIDNAFVNLKVLSKLQPFERLNTKQTLFYVESDSQFPYLVFVFRWWRSDGRSHMVTRLRELYDYVVEYLESTDDEPTATRIQEHLYASAGGLENLKKTYAGDMTTVSQLENLYDKIKDRMQAPAPVDRACKKAKMH